MFVGHGPCFIIFIHLESRESREDGAIVARRFDDLCAKVGQCGACPTPRHQARPYLAAKSMALG